MTTGPETTGPETPGPETTGPDLTGPDLTGPDLTGQDADPAEVVAARVDRLLDQLRAGPDPRTAVLADELVRCLVQLYGDGLDRIVRIAGPARTAELCADPLVESLLLVHDLHPLDTSARVRQAVEGVLPQLGSHAGDVEYLGLDDQGVLRLRLVQGGCSAATARDLISKAVAAAAPEAAGVGIEMVAPPAELPLLQIGRHPMGLQGTR